MAADKLIFLSHIHEEKDLALLIKKHLEDEFSGFVDIFVSSDSSSVPVGSNFLKKIENSLVKCNGAIYLISPFSVKSNWVNFELGAAWVRSVISVNAGGPEIPILPICHSGMIPKNLPAPLNSLNAVTGRQSSQLEFAFCSLQTAVGGKGRFKTDFETLANNIIAFEQNYTIGTNIAKMLSILGGDKNLLIQQCKQPQQGGDITLNCGFIETSIIQLLKEFETNELKGHIKVNTKKPGLSFTPKGAVNGAEVTITISGSLLLKYEKQILAL